MSALRSHLRSHALPESAGLQGTSEASQSPSNPQVPGSNPGGGAEDPALDGVRVDTRVDTNAPDVSRRGPARRVRVETLGRVGLLRRRQQLHVRRSSGPIGSRLRFRLADVQAEPAEVDVAPVESRDLRASQARVEREGVRDLIVAAARRARPAGSLPRRFRSRARARSSTAAPVNATLRVRSLTPPGAK